MVNVLLDTTNLYSPYVTRCPPRQMKYTGLVLYRLGPLRAPSGPLGLTRPRLMTKRPPLLEVAHSPTACLATQRASIAI